MTCRRSKERNQSRKKAEENSRNEYKLEKINEKKEEDKLREGEFGGKGSIDGVRDIRKEVGKVSEGNVCRMGI